MRTPIARGALALGLALVAAPGPARAFSELTRFAEPAIDGGGEGRYFTGAPTDGLGCSVCHDGGPTPEVTLTGLPDSLVAGATYQLSFTWPDDGRVHALAVELVDAAGAHPAVTVPPLAQQPAAMRCTEPAGTAAVSTVDLGARRVVAVAPCGARELTFSFTPSSSGPLYLGAGVVTGDDSETPDGDGVRELRATLGAGADGGGCSAGGAAASPAAIGLAAALVLLVDRRRRAVRS